MKKFVLLICLFCCYSVGNDVKAQHVDSCYKAGQFYSKHGAYDQALKHYFDALKECQPEAWSERSKITNAVGLVYIRIDKRTKARKYLNLALDYADKSKEDVAVSYAENSLGILESNAGNEKKAIAHYQRSLQLKKKLRDSLAISRSLTNLGAAEVKRGEFREGINYYFESLRYKLALEDSIGLATLYCNIGDAYGHLGILDSTHFYLFKGLGFAEALEAPQLLLPYYHNLGELYHEWDSLGKVIHYQRLFIESQKKVFSESVSRELANQEVKYQLSANKKELEIVQGKAKLLKKNQYLSQKRQQVLWLIVIALGVVIVMFYFVMKYRSRTIEQERNVKVKEQKLTELKFKQELQEKERLKEEKGRLERELTTISMIVLRRNEALSELYETLIESRKSKTISDAQVLNEMARLLQNSLTLDKDWDNFKQYFERVHPNFFEHLVQYYPNLSQTDHRHMAYMRIGLTTKEISRLLNITPESVQKSRGRLKKKLGLSREDDLFDFVKTI